MEFKNPRSIHCLLSPPQPTQAGGNQVELSQDFLLVWNCFYNSVEKEIALLQGKSFGEWLLYTVSSQATSLLERALSGQVNSLENVLTVRYLQ